MKKLICFFLFFLCTTVNATDLKKKLSDFFCKEYSLDKKNIKVIIHNTFRKKVHCSNPVFFISNKTHYFGLIDVLLTCDQFEKHLKTELQVTGKYIIANRFIPQGTRISAEDLKTVMGRLDVLPYQTYLHKKDIINKVNLNNIFSSQKITSLMIRPAWLVKINQRVTVVVQGIDFQIISQGKALKNASENQILSVKMYNDQLLTGIVSKNGEVVIHI